MDICITDCFSLSRTSISFIRKDLSASCDDVFYFLRNLMNSLEVEKKLIRRHEWKKCINWWDSQQWSVAISTTPEIGRKFKKWTRIFSFNFFFFSFLFIYILIFVARQICVIKNTIVMGLKMWKKIKLKMKWLSLKIHRTNFEWWIFLFGSKNEKKKRKKKRGPSLVIRELGNKHGIRTCYIAIFRVHRTCRKRGSPWGFRTRNNSSSDSWVLYFLSLFFLRRVRAHEKTHVSRIIAKLRGIFSHWQTVESTRRSGRLITLPANRVAINFFHYLPIFFSHVRFTSFLRFFLLMGSCKRMYLVMRINTLRDFTRMATYNHVYRFEIPVDRMSSRLNTN